MKGILFTQPNFLLTIEGKKTNTRRKAIRIMSRYKAGEKVYLKEPYCIISERFGEVLLHYPYTDEKKVIADVSRNNINKVLKQQEASKSGYCNKMFMPEWAARYYIVIADVERQRLQDISDEDCLAEGIIEERPEFYDCEPGPPKYGPPKIVTELRTVLPDELYDTPQEAYAAEFNAIDGKGAWESNPLVYSYYYELV
jgi:hypothetical protein